MFQQIGHRLSGGELLDGAAEVFVGVALAGEGSGHFGKDLVKVEAVGAAEKVVGKGKVEDDQAAAGLQDAVHFPEGGGIAGHVAEAEGDGDDVEGSVGKREVERVRHDRLVEAAGSGVRQHFGAEVGRDDFAAGAGVLDFEGEVAGAAGDVEQAGGFPFADAGGDDAPPPDVRAEAENMVGEDVAVRDAGERVADVGGVRHEQALLFPGQEASGGKGFLIDPAPAGVGSLRWMESQEPAGWEGAEVNRDLGSEGKLAILSDMIRSRALEKAALKYYKAAKMGGWLILQTGQEGVSAGVCSLLGREDHTIAGARGMGLSMMRGVSMERCLAELMGKVTGASKGKAGMFSFYEPAGNHWGCHALAAAHTPLAAGLAFALKQREVPGAVVCFLGDGAVNQGVYHETLNLAGLFGLPVVFLIENNGYAMGTSVKRSSAFRECLAKRAEMYDIDWSRGEGHDVFQVRALLEPALRRARHSCRPTVVEMETYRFHGFSVADANHRKYRTDDEIDWHKKHRDPIRWWSEHLTRQGIVDQAAIDRMREAAKREAEGAAKAAEKSRPPEVSEILEEVYWETDHATPASRIGRYFFEEADD